MKRCPFCAEEIQDAAIVCRYCHRDLVPQPKALFPAANTPAPRGRWFPWLLGAGVIFVGLLALLDWATSSHSVDRAAAEEAVALLQQDGLLTEFDYCSTNTPFFPQAEWVRHPAQRRRNIMLALSRVCLDRNRPSHIELRDPSSRRTYARFDGSTLTDLTIGR